MKYPQTQQQWISVHAGCRRQAGANTAGRRYAPNKIVLQCGGHAIYQIEDPRFESPERPDKLGIPAHFSLELPRRCMTLINELLPATATVFAGPKDRAMGGLTSTFLLSMAGPMLTLPIERIERQLQKKEREGYADDRRLNPTLSDALKNELGGGRFRRAPFFAPGQWSFTEWPADINIANEMPTELCTALGSDEAFARAAALETSRWCSCLRNALAHGGIAYLNGYGHSSYHGGPVEMFCFISGKYAERGDETPVALNCLRIRESHFLDFLQRWVNWLEASSVMKQLAA